MKVVYVALCFSLIGFAAAQSVARASASSGPDGMTSYTYSTGEAQAVSSASDGKNKIVCESPVAGYGKAIVCSGELPKNVTGAIILYSKVKGSTWCLKAEADGNIVLSSKCSGTYLWYFDEAYGLRPVYSPKCAAISLDDKSYFSGNCYLEDDENICEDVVSQWYFDGYKIKNQANPELCLTVCVSPEDGCNTIPGIDTSEAYGVAIAPCQDTYAQLWIPENVQVSTI
eukprot:TRINITY_DN662_c0_g1_i9.p3 TRINITY_DN662_c0_g1~~TRINITY_DN662_c0_g1_i9.p3  ORF type:complete len:228 (+),score=59.11 TRINITY_DN662_c0_g1_i9:131-814(+)